ncbi:MAG: hypothetical protein KF777_00190 [Planctomycetaceae bacterium]|nr:hypothetical protein [Planctomycetaceae bacterium]
MPRLSRIKHGCNCLHENTATDSPDADSICCPDLPTSHCAYAVLVECDHNQLGAGPMSTSVLWPCSILRKECTVGCVWSIWRRRALEVDDSPAPSICDTTAKNGIVRVNDANRTQAYCTWVDAVAAGAVDSPGVDDWESFTTLFHRMWKLEPDGTGGAILTLTTDDQVVGQEGLTAVYTCAAWDWNSKGVFILESIDAGLRQANLQCSICVVPVDSETVNPCNDPAHKCTCCDPGWDEGVFTFIISGCPQHSGQVGVQVTRNATLPCGVSDPDGACGYFWGTTGSGLGLLSWCDGTDWHVEVFCLIDGCWVSQGEADITNQECRCVGIWLTFTLPELDCCACPTISDYPSLVLDLVSDCAAFDCEIPLAGVSGSIWDANGSGCVPQAILTCSSNSWQLQPNVSCQGLPTLTGSVTSVSPLIITFPSVSWTDTDNCCGGGAGVSYVMSATVSL